MVVNRLGTRVDPAGDVIEVDGVRLETETKHRYFVLNKPAGYLSTARDPHGRPHVMDLVHEQGRFFPVGRLDLNSRGLMLITNDGFVAHRLTHPRFGVEKRYLVRVKGRVTAGKLKVLREGVELEEGRTAPAKVRLLGSEEEASLLEFRLHQGWKRQIRRMCEAVGWEVIDLVRTKIGSLTIKGLPEGEYRELTPEEVTRLKKDVLEGPGDRDRQ